MFRRATSAESCILKVPEAAFLGLAKGASPFATFSSLIFSKELIGINPSPRTSKVVGNLSELTVSGIRRIVLTFSVISSPLVPSPRVTPLIKRPFSYQNDKATPSNFNSHIYS